MKIGFIGLGIMGESMCENIVKKHDDTVYVFDFVKEKVELLASKGAAACADSVELAEKFHGSEIRAFPVRVYCDPWSTE